MAWSSSMVVGVKAHTKEFKQWLLLPIITCVDDCLSDLELELVAVRIKQLTLVHMIGPILWEVQKIKIEETTHIALAAVVQ